jgi:hypothetical protein
MRWINMLLLAALVSLLSAAPAAAQLTGSYTLAQVNDQPLPAPSPEEADVVVLTMALVLAPDGRFRIEATATLDGGSEKSEQSVEGAWTVDADSLTLTPDVGEDDGVLQFRWALEGGTLKLYPENGHEFTFRRT